jgi:sec-independent protein translocase protein TatB
MFDIGWAEMLLIGAVALLVIGPKELPGALKTFAYWMRQARSMAREFQSGVDDMIRQAELDDARKAIEDARRGFTKDIEKAVDPTGEMKQALSDTPIRTPTPSAPVSPPKPAASSAASAASPPAAAAPAELPAESEPVGSATPSPAQKSA